jgi:hypothetical protein
VNSTGNIQIVGQLQQLDVDNFQREFFLLFSKSDEFGAFFLMRNPLYRLTSYFIGQNGPKNLAVRKSLGCGCFRGLKLVRSLATRGPLTYT